MTWSAGIVLSMFVILKLVERSISRMNEAWLKDMGGIESEGVPYNWFAILQVLFYMSLLFELYTLQGGRFLSYFWLAVVLLIASIKIWCMRTKGSFWNLKGIAVPRIRLMRQGPYKMVRYPDYWILAGELIAIPLVFQLHVTMVLFLLLHCSLLIVQLPGQSERKVS